MKYPRYKYVLLLLDLITISISFILAYILKKYFQNPGYYFLNIDFFYDVSVLMMFTFIVVFFFHYSHLYKINVFLTRAKQTIKILTILGLSAIGIGAISFFIKAESGFFVSRLGIAIFFLVLTSLMIFSRLIIFPLLYFKYSKASKVKRNILIIGATKYGRLLAASSIVSNIGWELIGFLDDNSKVGERIFQKYKNIGNIKDLEKICDEYKVDKIIICLENVTHEKLLDIILRSRKTGRTVRIASSHFDIIEERLFIEKIDDIPFIGILKQEPSSIDLLIKRIFDICLSVIGMIILLPAICVFGIIIKITSKGPVIFTQIRIGKNGQPFKFYKFRTMYNGSHVDSNRESLMKGFIKGEQHDIAGSKKILDESKVTKIGKFLRKTSIDELPQLYNVIKGDMSLVGPRPCLPYEWEHYEEWHKKRLSVPPGCTGIWQVSGRSYTSFQDMVIMDLYYIYNYSLFLDLQLILKTIPVMINGSGAK